MDTAHARVTTTGGRGARPIYDAFLSYSHSADELLAPRLHSGLQRFAKAWWKRQILRVFRDEGSLSANPHLWVSITDAMDDSAWFVLLLSPEAADSEWVNREVAWWLQHKDPDRVIPVLTDGDLVWADGDLAGDAVPPALRGAFVNEPRWVDLRFARSDEQLDLRNARFSAAVADIASAIRGIPKDELESEEVRQHRRMVRTAWAAGIAVAFLALVAGGLALYATLAQGRADREAKINHSMVLAGAAEDAFDNGEIDLALALGLEAVAVDDPPAESRRVLSALALGPGTRAVLEGHSHSVRDAALSPDARLALSGSCAQLDAGGFCTDGELILWDVEAGAEVARFDGHSDWVTGVAFGPDGQTALSGSNDATLILWDVATGAVIRRFQGHDAGVTAVAFSPDGQTALSSSDDTTLIAWDVGTGRVIRRFGGHQNAVTDATFHPDGDVVLSVGADLSLRSWSLATGEETHRTEFLVGPASVAITPDGRTALVSIAVDLRQWDVGRWEESGRLGGHGMGEQTADINAIAIGPGGRLAISAGSDGTLRVWNLAGHNEVRRFDTDGTDINGVAVDPDSTRVLTGLLSGETTLWDAADGRVIRRFGGEGFPVSPDCVDFGPHGTDWALVCAEDAFGDTGATSLILWDLSTGEEVRRFEGHSTYVRALAVSPDGRTALAGSQSLPFNESGDLILWDLATANEVRRFDHTADITNIAISADGTRAVTGSVTGFVAILWDMETGEPIRRFEGHPLPILNVAFGPGDETVLTASFDGTLILWDAGTGEILRRFVGHEDSVWGLDVSPDGRSVASSAFDGTVIVWDFETGGELIRLAAHAAPASDVAFSPDGETLFSVGFDGQLIEWRVPSQSLDELVDWIHANRYVRELTCEERDRYGIDSPAC